MTNPIDCVVKIVKVQPNSKSGPLAADYLQGNPLPQQEVSSLQNRSEKMENVLLKRK